MNTLQRHLLKNLNLTEAQGRVYLTALELGQASIQTIAKKSGVKRSTIYTFIEDLVERNFIFALRKKKRILYSAAHPENLVEREKIRLAEIQSALPELLAIHNQSRTKPRVTFYEGVDGIKEVYADTLKDRKPMVGWSDYEQSKKILGNFYTTYAEERGRRNILYRGIARDTPAAREKMSLSNRELRDLKLSPLSSLTTELYIYGNKVAMISFRSTPPFAVVMEDASIAETLSAIWEDSWNYL